MEHKNNRFHKQRGEISLKLIIFGVGIIAFFMIKGMGNSPKIKGKMDYALISEFGEPVSKREVPRPR